MCLHSLVSCCVFLLVMHRVAASHISLSSPLFLHTFDFNHSHMLNTRLVLCFSCSAASHFTSIAEADRVEPGAERLLLICLSVNMRMGIRDVFSPGVFLLMSCAHAAPFRGAFILICTSRGWNGAGLVSLHQCPCGPITTALRSRDETPRR